MTQEPDEALLYARAEYATRFIVPEHLRHHALNGDHDHRMSLRQIAQDYRAGQAAAEAKVKELEVEVITYSGMHRQAADEAIGLAIKVEQAKVVEQWQRQRIEALKEALSEARLHLCLPAWHELDNRIDTLLEGDDA